VTQEKLNLVQLTTGQMAEARASSPQIVWGQLLDAGAARSLPHDFPEHLGGHTVAPHAAGFVDCTEHAACADVRGGGPVIDRSLHPGWYWHGSDVPGLAAQVCDDPVFLPELDGLDPQGQEFSTPEATADQQGEHRVISS
jgi:hypothetical protein